MILETAQDLIDLFRKQVDDRSKPYLWDDVESLQYAVAAQDMYARLTGGIADSSTASVVDAAVTPGEPMARLSPYILRIRSAKLVTARRPLEIVNEADISQMQQAPDYGVSLRQYLDDENTGDVTAMVLGVEKNKVRWWRVPPSDADEDTCRMNVLRLPYPRIQDEKDCLEVDEQHRLSLVMWMKYLAYSKEDAETYDKELAENNERAFYRYCGVPDGANARQEEERQRYKPRTIQYGGL